MTRNWDNILSSILTLTPNILIISLMWRQEWEGDDFLINAMKITSVLGLLIGTVIVLMNLNSKESIKSSPKVDFSFTQKIAYLFIKRRKIDILFVPITLLASFFVHSPENILMAALTLLALGLNWYRIQHFEKYFQA